MRRTTLLASIWSTFLLVVVTFLFVRPVAPDTIYEGDVCYKCRRVVDDTRMAAETLDRQLPTKYRSPGCLAAYVAAHPAGVDTRMFVTDYVSGRLIAAERATFVSVLVNDRTGERDFRAYHSPVAAREAARMLGTGVVSWATVLERARARA